MPYVESKWASERVRERERERADTELGLSSTFPLVVLTRASLLGLSIP